MFDNNRKVRSKKSFFRHMLSKLIINTVNRFNFVTFVKKIALSDKNQSTYQDMQKVPEDWQNTEEIKKIAVLQTVAQFEQKGEKVNLDEIKKIINDMAIQYNREIHVNSATFIDIVLRHIFDYPIKNCPFTSLDCRELKYLDKLKQMKKKGYGVVYLINHSSHLDEFIFNLLCQRKGLGLPVYAAGQNMMMIKSIARLLMVGSYVVLRQGASKYQMAALYHYCSALSKARSQQGIFLEAWRGGARTRDGSLRYPKKLVTLKGAIDVDDDVIIQPVAMSYSTVPEEMMMSSRKSVISWIKGMGFFRTILKIPFYPKMFLWRSLENIYGRAFVTMPEPILLSDLKKQHSNDKSGISLDEFVALFSIKEIAKNKKIMSSQLVARSLIHAKKSESHKLIDSVKSQLNDIQEYHQNTFRQPADIEDFITNNNRFDIVKDGLKTLRKRGVLSKWQNDIHGLPLVRDENALSYYATHGDRRLYSPTSDQNIVIVGADSWGFALSLFIGSKLLDNKKYANASLTIYDSRSEIVEQIGFTRHGTGRFSDKLLPKNVFITSDLPCAFRKASEVILASDPEDFENHSRSIIMASEQPMRIIIATRGFIPGTNSLPYHFLAKLIEEYKRKDIEIFVLAGPVTPEALVYNNEINGILAGASESVRQLAQMFGWSSEHAIVLKDPIGAHAADTLARIYSIWLNFLISSSILKHSSDIGYITASIGDEARQFAIAAGAYPETFNIGSIPWTATFISVSMEGPWYDFGKKVGLYAKKHNNKAYQYMQKVNDHASSEKIKLQFKTNIIECLKCAKTLNINMPIMTEMYKTFWYDNSEKG